MTVDHPALTAGARPSGLDAVGDELGDPRVKGGLIVVGRRIGVVELGQTQRDHGFALAVMPLTVPGPEPCREQRRGTREIAASTWIRAVCRACNSATRTKRRS